MYIRRWIIMRIWKEKLREPFGILQGCDFVKARFAFKNLIIMIGWYRQTDCLLQSVPVSPFNKLMEIGENEENIKAFFTPEELAEFLAISRATVYRLVGKRQLPFHKIGGVLRFKKADIEEYLETGRVEPIVR